MVVINSFGQGIRGVLMQYGQVIAYESPKSKNYEQNYASHDLDLVAIIHALQIWCHYLLGNPFEF